MDFRVQDYLGKLIVKEFDESHEKKLFNLGMAWGFCLFIEQFRGYLGADATADKITDDWLMEMSKDEAIGQYIRDIITIKEEEMSPSEKLKQELLEEHRRHKRRIL